MGIENLDVLKPEGGDESESTETKDAPVEVHAVDENPEDHCGDEVPDPWAPSDEDTQEVKS